LERRSEISGLTLENAIPILPRTLSVESPGVFQATRPANEIFLPFPSIDPSTGVPGIRTRIDSVQNPPLDTSRVKDTACPSITLKRRRCRSSLRTLRMVLLRQSDVAGWNGFSSGRGVSCIRTTHAFPRWSPAPGDDCLLRKALNHSGRMKYFTSAKPCARMEDGGLIPWTRNFHAFPRRLRIFSRPRRILRRRATAFRDVAR